MCTCILYTSMGVIIIEQGYRYTAGSAVSNRLRSIEHHLRSLVIAQSYNDMTCLT